MTDLSSMVNIPSLLGYGGAFALVGGSLFTWAKSAPMYLKNIILNQFTVRVTIRDIDPLFPSLNAFFYKETFMKGCKRLLANCSDTLEEGSSGYSSSGMSIQGLKSGILFSRAPGIHLIRYKGSYILMERLVDEKKGMVNRTVESITLRTFGRQDSLIKNLLQEVKNEAEDLSSSYIDIRSSNKDGYWRKVDGCRRRNLNTIILRDDLLPKIVEDIRGFLGRSDFYYKTGTPYHRGYLLEGPPGGGKSSLVQALATHFSRPLYVLNLNGLTGDQQLRELFECLPKGSFLLLEDIDTIAPSKDRTSSEESEEERFCAVTLGGLLNVLDGIFASDGIVVFMTTNHPEKLDAALVRPGRIDERVVLDYASHDQAKRLYLKFRNNPEGADEFARQAELGKISMAALQEQLISESLIFGDEKKETK